MRWDLERKARALPNVPANLRYAIGAREEVTGAGELLRVTAADILS